MKTTKKSGNIRGKRETCMNEFFSRKFGDRGWLLHMILRALFQLNSKEIELKPRCMWPLSEFKRSWLSRITNQNGFTICHRKCSASVRLLYELSIQRSFHLSFFSLWLSRFFRWSIMQNQIFMYKIYMSCIENSLQRSINSNWKRHLYFLWIGTNNILSTWKINILLSCTW